MKQHAGIDVQAMYPAGSAAEGRRLDARRLPQGRRGLPQGRLSRSASASARPSDNVDTAGAIFQSFGAELVDAKGNITVKTDAVRQALEYYKKLAQFLPPDAPAWDDASNNKWLVSGKGALIMNPPSAWAVAKRDAPQGRRAVLDARHAGRARRAASRRSCRTSGASGTSARTRRRPRACCCTCRSRRRSRRWWWRAAATTCRRSRS